MRQHLGVEDAVRRRHKGAITFLELASEAIGDPLLGFHLAETFDPRELGLLYYVQASSVTLGEALGCMTRYISVAHEGLDASCVDRDGLKVRISYVGVPRHADRQQMEALVTAVIRIGRQLTGHRLRPIRIALAHPRSAASAEFETLPWIAHRFRRRSGRDRLFGSGPRPACRERRSVCQ
jgi:hypothetical protein